MRREREIDTYPVVTLCGSMRFYRDMLAIASRLTKRGYIVLAPFVKAETQGLKEMLDDMHFRKIDISGAIYVVNIGGYVGTSTQREIDYAREQGKNIMYHESEQESEQVK